MQLETSSVVATPVSHAELVAQRRRERRRLNALTTRLSKPPVAKEMGKFINHSPITRRRRIAPTPTRPATTSDLPHCCCSPRPLHHLTLTVPISLVPPLTDPFASVSALCCLCSLPLPAGTQALLTPTFDALDAPLTPGICNLLDQIAQETDTATAAIATDPRSLIRSLSRLLPRRFSPR